MFLERVYKLLLNFNDFLFSLYIELHEYGDRLGSFLLLYGGLAAFNITSPISALKLRNGSSNRQRYIFDFNFFQYYDSKASHHDDKIIQIVSILLVNFQPLSRLTMVPVYQNWISVFFNTIEFVHVSKKNLFNNN